MLFVPWFLLWRFLLCGSFACASKPVGEALAYAGMGGARGGGMGARGGGMGAKGGGIEGLEGLERRYRSLQEPHRKPTEPIGGYQSL